MPESGSPTPWLHADRLTRRADTNALRRRAMAASVARSPRPTRRPRPPGSLGAAGAAELPLVRAVAASQSCLGVLLPHAATGQDRHGLGIDFAPQQRIQHDPA